MSGFIQQDSAEIVQRFARERDVEQHLLPWMGGTGDDLSDPQIQISRMRNMGQLPLELQRL